MCEIIIIYDALREEPLENWYNIGSVITIVNANLPLNMSPQADYMLASQAVSAGCVVFSRTQLVKEEDIENTKAHIEAAANMIKAKRIPDVYVTKPWNEFSDDDYSYIMKQGYRITGYVKTIAGSDVVIVIGANLDKKKISKLIEE